LDERKSLVAIPLGTIVQVSEPSGAVVIRWPDSAADWRELFYPPETWRKHISKHMEPLEQIEL
jgi:hypothetical protein